MTELKVYWLSWWHRKGMGNFTLMLPWWSSGEFVEDKLPMCGAVKAIDDQSAKQIILDAYSQSPKHMKWRFCVRKPNDWSPWDIMAIDEDGNPLDTTRYPKAEWMIWDEITPNFDQFSISVK